MNQIYCYSFGEDTSDKRKCAIKVFGLTRDKKSVCLHIENFFPSICVELPKNIPWSKQLVSYVVDSLKNMGIGKGNGIVKAMYTNSKKLYCNTNNNSCDFLRLYFKSQMYINFFKKNVTGKQINVLSIGALTLKLHEDTIAPILQFYSKYDLPSAGGWIEFKGKRLLERETYCDIEYEVDVSINNSIKKHNCEDVVYPTILSFDCEVNSSVAGTFPQAKREGDVVFQISCVMLKDGEIEKYLLALGEPEPGIVGDDVEIRMFDNEGELLQGYRDFVIEKNPQVIIGYNIFGFDIQYMYDRAKSSYILDTYCKQSCIMGSQSLLKPISWSSSAFGDQKLSYLDTDGRIHIDLLPLIRRNYNLDNYRLQTVSQHFLKQSKDPLDSIGIFRCYRLFTPESLGICGKYCVQDSLLVLKLFEHLKVWYELTELAKVCNVPIIYIYTRGQQIRVFSQVYKECLHNNIIVNQSDGQQYVGTDFEGALVFDPVVGLHKDVVSFDFSSLYPSTIIAYNLSYDTMISDNSLPDTECHVIEWSEHVNCNCLNAVTNEKRAVFCGVKKYKFRKSPVGVLPTVLTKLLNERAKVRSDMKNCSNDKTLLQILDKRQLALKVSSNSAYGSLGTSVGYLPFMPAAECTTAMGRKNIQLASKFMQDAYGAKILYGDTDSQYLFFPNVPLEKLHAFCYKVQDEVSSIFPKPMKMAYEEKVMRYFLIFTKKRYIAQEYPKGDKPGAIIKKGIVLVRRDTCAVTRKMYTEIVNSVFKDASKQEIQSLVIDMLNNMFCMRYPYTDFKITKSTKDAENYKKKPLPDDPIKRSKRLQDLGCVDESEYNMMCLPAQTQLGEKMKQRGESVGSGTRIEYVIIQIYKSRKSDDKLFRKIEDIDYFGKHRDILRLDYIHYLEHLIFNPIEELLQVICINPFFLKEQITLREQKRRVCEHIIDLFNPKVLFD